jgi:hypothetical protein
VLVRPVDGVSFLTLPAKPPLTAMKLLHSIVFV